MFRFFNTRESKSERVIEIEIERERGEGVCVCLVCVFGEVRSGIDRVN